MSDKRAVPQSYRNHRRVQPTYHLLLLPLGGATLVASIVHLVLQNGTFESWLLLSLSFMVCAGNLIFRRYAIVVQDRTIQTAEQFRHYMLTGQPLDPQLTRGQIIALRFASDDQFPSLAAEAVKHNMTQTQIKQAIKDWRPDTHRV